MTLWNLGEAESAVVDGFKTTLPMTYKLRLRELGFEENQIVFCLRHGPFGGPHIFQIGDSVFSLAEELASEVEIKAQGQK